MSGVCCKCGEQTLPVEKRNWVLVHYKSTVSKTHSDYSEIKCLTCGARWQTKAKYVESLNNRRFYAKEETGCIMTSAALKLRKSRRRCEK